MARKFLTGIDLAGCELLNAVVQNLATEPPNPTPGRFYYDIAQGIYRGYGSDGWIDFGGGVDGYTKAEVDTAIETAITNLIGGAPDALDTLNELAAALSDDANYASSVTTLLGNKVDKIDGMGLSTNDYTTEERTKLAGIDEGATNYTHPDNHDASIITEDETHRFATDTEKTAWNAKADIFTTTVGDGSSTTITVTHNLGTMDIVISMYEAASPYNMVMTDIQITDVNNIKLIFASAPTADEYKVVITG
jgi:hypothetical protein